MPTFGGENVRMTHAMRLAFPAINSRRPGWDTAAAAWGRVVPPPFGQIHMRQDMNHPQEHIQSPLRRRLLLAAAGGLCAPLALAQTTPAPAAGLGGVILEPIALAILHHGRSGSWSSRRLLRNYLRAAGPTGLPSLQAQIPQRLQPWVPQAVQINAAWLDLLRAGNEFERGRALGKLAELLDAYAAQVLAADRYLLPLSGQGVLSYDYLDQELLNDAGLADPRAGFGVLRFNTLEPGKTGALELLNLRVQQLTPSLRAPAELYRIPVESPDLAERLVRDNARHLQLLEIRLARQAECSLRPEALRGASAPLAALATELQFVAEDGSRLSSLAIESRRGCAKPRKARG